MSAARLIKTIPLIKPITAHGAEVNEIQLCEPETQDVMELGFPTMGVFAADGENAGIEIRAKVVGQYIMRLGKIPMSSVKALHISDFMKCQNEIIGFFGAAGGSA
jgi:Phage tail assembly chaperone proteins, E, or 41 or 14